MIVQFIFVHTFRRILTDAYTIKRVHMNRVPDGSIFNSSPRWIFLLFYSKFDKLSRFVHKSNIAHGLNNIYKTRLQSATKKKGCIDRSRHRCMLFWPESQMDLSKNKLKPNKLINWLISQQMLLGIIILRLMNVLRYKTIFSYEDFK